MRGIRNDFLIKSCWWLILRFYKLRDVVRPKAKSSHILMFHDIDLDCAENFSVSEERFKEIIEWHIRNNYRFVSMDEIFSHGFKGKCCAITFDDGKTNFLKVYPFLKESKIPFCLYIISSKMDEEGYLSSGQLREIKNDALCTIGSHTANHVKTRFLNRRTLEMELTESKKNIEKAIGQDVYHFAFPHGDLITTSIFDEVFVQKAEYKTAVKTNQIPISNATRKYSIPRFDGSREDLLSVL